MTDGFAEHRKGMYNHICRPSGQNSTAVLPYFLCNQQMNQRRDIYGTQKLDRIQRRKMAG